MKVVFRVDASVDMGSGHVMRCLTLAKALRNRGADIFFICREHDGHLCDLISSEGFLVVRFPVISGENVESTPVHASWLGSSWEKDAEKTREKIQSWGITPDWLIVDHYGLDKKWGSAIRPYVKKILIIDDLADRELDCDLLLDQNFYTDVKNRYIGKVPLRCKLLLGVHYALLREEFYSMRKKIRNRTTPVKRVLIFFGGVDIDDLTSSSIKTLVNLGISDLEVDVVIGINHPNRKGIEKLCIDHGYCCYVQSRRMAELMLKADFAIGAGGSTNWERCCMGLPTILFAVAQNQVKTSQALVSYGAAYSGENNVIISQAKNLSKDIETGVNYLLTENNLQLMSEKAAELVDGQGAVRVSDILIKGVVG